MSQQPIALLLAEKLEQQFPVGTAQRYLDGEAAAELRRLHMENEDLKNACKIYSDALKEEKALNAQLLEALNYIQHQTHLGHIHDTASAAIAAAKGEA